MCVDYFDAYKDCKKNWVCVYEFPPPTRTLTY